VDVAWAGGELVTARVTSAADDACVVRYRDREVRIPLPAGGSVVLDRTLSSGAE
jgi:hypothetical protein